MFEKASLMAQVRGEIQVARQAPRKMQVAPASELQIGLF